MNIDKELRPTSPMFWLVLLPALGIIFIGARFWFDPVGASAAFGVPSEGHNFAYQWAKGTRDIGSGLISLALLALNAGRRVIGAFIGVAALIPLGDFVNVYRHEGTGNPVALAIHSGTAVFMLILASFLWRTRH